MLFRNIVLYTFFTFFLSFAKGQQIEGNISFHGFADNREYSKSGRYPQTIFGARVTPEIGVLIDSTHRIRLGVSYLHEFGTQHISKPVRPVAYYNYLKNGLDFKIGMFPRHEYLDDYPKVILSDTIGYYQPNIEGILLKFKNSRIEQQLWIDWNSRQTVLNREQFMVGISGKVKLNPVFYFKHYAVLWHNALTKVSSPNEHIRDNGALSVYFGADFSNKGWLDSIHVNVGGIVNYDRLRNVYDWSFPKGFLNEIYLEHHKFFIRNTFYKGESMALPYGDVFYTSKQYDRLDIGWIPLRYNGLEGRFTVGLHFSEGVMDNQQQFILRYNVGYKSGNKKK